MSDINRKLTLTAGDTYPIDIYIVDENDTAVDITGATSVSFSMAAPGSDTAVASGSCTVVDASAGHVRYSWGAGETDTPGTYYGQVSVTFSGGIRHTRRFVIEIEEAIPT